MTKMSNVCLSLLVSVSKQRYQFAVTIVGIAYRYITRIDRTLQQALTVITITKLHSIIIYFAYFRFYTVVIVVGIAFGSGQITVAYYIGGHLPFLVVSGKFQQCHVPFTTAFGTYLASPCIIPRLYPRLGCTL